MKGALSGSWRMLATAWRIDRVRTCVALVLVILAAVAAPLLAAVLRWMTNSAAAGEGGAATLAGAALATLALANITFGHFAHIAYFELSELAEVDFDRELAMISNGTRGIEHQEDPALADTMALLRQESRRYRAGFEALLNCTGLLLAMVMTAVLLARLDPWLLLLPLAALPPLLTGRAAEERMDRAREASAGDTRVALNLFHLSTSPRVAGELRVFRLRGELLDRHDRLWRAGTRTLWRGQLSGTALRILGQVIFALGYAAAVLLVVRDAAEGHRSVGDVVMVVVLAAQVNQQVTTASVLLQSLQRMSATYRRLDLVRDRVAEIEQAAARPQAAAAAAPATSAAMTSPRPTP
ncbi:hypothetical protein KDL01_04475, partial [Actinospica durhamensis]